MQHPELNIDLSTFEPLLSDETLNEMQDLYLQVLIMFQSTSFSQLFDSY